MKKLFLSTTLLVGLLSIQAHADYVSPTTSVASQAAQYSVMDINSLIKAAKAGQPAAQFYLATKYQQGKVAVSILWLGNACTGSYAITT